MILKICYLADGKSVHTQKWVRYFADKGHNVCLVTFNETKPIEGVEVKKLRYFSKFAYPFRIFEVKKAVKKIAPDILHAHYVSHYGMYAALTGFKPLVVSVWGSDVLVDPKRSMMKSYVVRYVLKKADLITVDSVSSFRMVVGFGADEGKVKLIIHGADLKMFHPVEDREEFKKDLGVPQSYHIVISTRSLESIYDIDTLIKAVPHILDDCPNTYFLIIGDGTQRRKLEELTHKLGVTENVRFVGLLPNYEIPKFLGISDVYVSTSLSDTTSVSLLEAMACELPVVVTDLEGNREWIKNGRNGFLFPQGHFKALAEKVIYLVKNEDTRRKFGIIGRRIVEKEAGYDKEMGKMEKLYKDLIEA